MRVSSLSILLKKLLMKTQMPIRLGRSRKFARRGERWSKQTKNATMAYECMIAMRRHIHSTMPDT